MGCDGGTIPKRSEMIKTKKKAKREKKQEKLVARWFYCALSNHELRRPVMGCELGRIYNKEELITALLDKPNKPDSIEHIRGLRDIRELKLTPNKSFDRKALEKAEGYIDYQNSEFICPILGVEMNGHYSFVFLWSCGCVFSQRALKQLDTDSCLVCGQARRENDVIQLYPEGDRVDEMRGNLLERRSSDKKLSSKKPLTSEANAGDREQALPEQRVSISTHTRSSDGESVDGVGNLLEKIMSSDKKQSAKRPLTSDAISQGCKEQALCKQTVSERNCSPHTGSSEGVVTSLEKKPKLEPTSRKKHKSLSNHRSSAPPKPHSTTNSILVKDVAASVSRYGKVSDNPHASKVYKSLFTSSQKEPPALQSPWVTYNPYRL